MEKIREDLPVFLHDGEVAIGAVRAVHKASIDVYIENAGDFIVPLGAVHDVHFDKVILDARKLEQRLREAIGRAHSAEDSS